MIPYQLSPRLPARKWALDTNTFKQTKFRSDNPGGCTGEVSPKFSVSDTAERGVAGSMYDSKLATTREGMANFARLVRNASLGVVSASIPATFVIA